MKRTTLARKTPLKAGSKVLPRRALQQVGEGMPKRPTTMKRRSPKPSDAKNRSAAWLAMVRSIPNCQHCGKLRPIQAAHQNQGKGIGMKVPDCLTAALCDTCHFEIDNGSKATLAERRWWLGQAIRKTIVYLFQHDLIGANAP